ncbi:MAG: hypothetical protein JKX75_04340 [Gammaproteobacteria bacterium]|nr:hypothetical protein [Gammaproteobacteria bacterium]
MQEDIFNMSVRKFLKKVGITSQREIDTVIRAAIEDGRINSNANVDIQVTLKIAALSKPLVIMGEIHLDDLS